MLDTNAITIFDYQLVCHAEVDLPAWLSGLTLKSGWKLWNESDDENCDVYLFRNGLSEAQVTLFHGGHAVVEVDGDVVYDDHLSGAGDYASMNYFNAESGQKVLLN